MEKVKGTVEIGDTARDLITGYQGVVLCHSKHLTGCDRFTLQAPVDKEGKIPEAYNFDITTVVLVEKATVKPVVVAPVEFDQVKKPGGPPSVAPRRR